MYRRILVTGSPIRGGKSLFATDLAFKDIVNGSRAQFVFGATNIRGVSEIVNQYAFSVPSIHPKNISVTCDLKEPFNIERYFESVNWDDWDILILDDLEWLIPVDSSEEVSKLFALVEKANVKCIATLSNTKQAGPRGSAIIPQWAEIVLEVKKSRF